MPWYWGMDKDAHTKQRAESLLGTVLREKWRLDRLIGLGGMAAVYAATHRNGKQAAIKILHPEAARIADIRARFLREGYLANRVQHTGALSILDDDVDEHGTVFLVMELLHGETLEARWHREKHIPWQEVCVIIDKMLDILVSAHAKAIIHRDLKPGNVFIEDTGGVKILDFGIARLHTVTPQRGDTGDDSALGTPGFMPPEQARGRWMEVDAQSDVWAVGATAFAVLTGRYVHEAPTVNEQLLAAMTEPAPPIGSLVPDLPGPFAAIVDRALSFDKSGRFAEARMMQRELRDAYEAATGERFASAPPLATRAGSVSRSVRPDAPTISAAELDVELSRASAAELDLGRASASALDFSRQSTARPVTGQPPRSLDAATKRRKALVAVAGGVAIVGIAAWFALHQRRAAADAEAQARAATANQNVAAPEPSIVTLPKVAGTAGSTSGGELPKPAPKAAAAAPKAPAAARAAPRPQPSASAAPAPKKEPSVAPENSSAPVDIFTRRK
jgi:serine/threonine-protein kinase